MSRDRAAPVRLAVLALTTAGATLLLLRAGRSDLAPPPVASGITGVRDWADGRDPVTAVLALGRLGGLGLAAYLSAVVVAGTAVRVVERAVPAAAGLVHLVDAVTPRLVRHALDAACRAGVAAGSLGLVLAPVRPAVAAEPVRAVASAAVTRSGAPPAPSPPTTAAHEDVPLLRRVDDAAPSPPRARPATWTVRRGEHFWSIAESVVAARAADRTPTEREVARYWVRLVAANRDRLPVRDNPDLLYPGTVIVLPAPQAS